MATASSDDKVSGESAGMPISELLVKNGIAKSAEDAKKLIRRGRIIAGGDRIYDECALLPLETEIKATGQGKSFVSRGGIKLEHALAGLEIDPASKICLDAGSSTGGFTDCLLAYGARKVYAVDVGYGLLEWELRNHPCVFVLERTNARSLSKVLVPDAIEIAAIDVNHISLSKILPAVFPLMTESGILIALFKPQFEIPKSWANREGYRKGVIESPELLRQVLHKILLELGNAGFVAKRILESPVKGAKGNREFLVRFEPSPPNLLQQDYVKIVGDLMDSV